MHGACAAQFHGAHLCHASEYLLANSAVAPPAEGAWMDSNTDINGDFTLQGSHKFGRFTGSGTCNSWTNNVKNATSGAFVTVAASVETDNDCGKVRAVACCADPRD